jgi:hypothetical protein
MKKNLLAFSILVFCVQAHAGERDHRACSAKALQGDWVSYQGTAQAGTPHTGVCRIHVAGGVATGDCDFSLGFTGPFQGAAMVNDDCSAEVTMDFAPAAFKSTFQFQLARNKQSFVGRWENNLGANGVSNGVKK